MASIVAMRGQDSQITLQGMDLSNVLKSYETLVIAQSNLPWEKFNDNDVYKDQVKLVNYMIFCKESVLFEAK
jgi:hypothetical protein